MHALPHSVHPALQQATADPGLCWRLLNTHSEVWVSLLWGHCSFLLGPGAQGSGCALLGSVSPVLCKFWWLYGVVNGDLLQEGLCHTQVYCTQSPCPCGRPLLTRTSAGDTQTQFWLSPITSWQTDGETVETVTDFILGGSKMTADGDNSHEIKRCLLLGRKAMTNLDSILKSRDITLLTKVHLVKAMVFPVVMYGCESWTVKKAEHKELMLLNCGVGEDS